MNERKIYMPNDFYDIDMIQTISDIVEEMDRKNKSKKELYKEYQIIRENLRKLYKNSYKELENDVYKLLNNARKKESELTKCSSFDVKDLGEIIAKFLTDTENREFYFKQIKVNYNIDDYYDEFYGYLTEDEKRNYILNSHDNPILSKLPREYNVIAYYNLDENLDYTFKELKGLTCFEYRPIYNKIIKIYNLLIHEPSISTKKADDIKLDLDKHPDFKMDNKRNAIELRIKIIEFVDALINYRIYHNLESITKEDLEKFEQEYILKYNKKEDNSRKLTK